MQEEIIKLKLLGQMPDAVKDDPTEETINMYDELLSNVKTPLTREEVGVLIDIFPEGGMYGVEWDLLKLVESYLIEAPSSEEYRKLITACPSEEWRETMQARLDNWENNKQYLVGEIAKPVEPVNGQDERRISCAAVDSPARLC